MNKMKRLFAISLTAIASLSLASCGSAPEGGGDEGDEEMYTIEGLEGEIRREDGEIVFDNEVTVNMWSVINEPDNVAMRALVAKFNEKYAGMIKINIQEFSVDDYYNSLDTAWNYTPDKVPDLALMHCEKIVSYAYKNYFYPLNEVVEKTGVEFDFSQIYSNVDRANIVNHDGEAYRYAIPIDTHTFLFSIRQDMIKKNELGFDNNTRFVPKNRAEWQQLMKGAREKADAGELWYRSIETVDYSKAHEEQPHKWKKLSTSQASKFSPAFMPIQDVTALSALYSNGGRLVNEDGDTITVQDSQGFKNFLKDSIDYYNNKYVIYPGETEQRTNQSMFGAGQTLMFEQGPWWVGQEYTKYYNNREMRTSNYQGNDTGITEEDAADPVYSYPMTAINPAGWFATEDHADNDKVYGNGHSIAITKKVKSLEKAAAILMFTHWLCQEKVDENDSSSDYNLTKHCLTGHLPAWKNVYESAKYKEQAADSLVLQALGDPAKIITMENLRYEETCVSAASKTVDALFSNLMSNNESLKTYDRAIAEMNDVVQSVQTALDLKIESES